jgi:hypothetical protein
MGEIKSKMKKSRGDEEKADSENIPPQVSRIRIADPGEHGPLHVPYRNAQKHEKKGAIHGGGLLLGINEKSYEEESRRSKNGGEGMNVQFIDPSWPEGRGACFACRFYEKFAFENQSSSVLFPFFPQEGWSFFPGDG